MDKREDKEIVNKEQIQKLKRGAKDRTIGKQRAKRQYI
jgi:hypothetical protein